MPDLKQIARRIFQQTLAAIDVHAAFQRKVIRAGSLVDCGGIQVDLAAHQRIVIVAFGKASRAMTEGLLDALAPDWRAEGVLCGPSPLPRELPGFCAFVGGHPVPNEQSVAAAEAILELLARCDERTLVFFLLSGGGSALVEKPLSPEIGLGDLQELNRVLVTCGASIDEINAVRKHFSVVKGGRLAAAAPRATKITLGISDVPPDKESALASGPTLPDPTTVEDAYRVVAKYNLLGKLPGSARAQIERRALRETPKAGDPAFARSHFVLVMGLDDLFHPAHRAAQAAGFLVHCDNSTDDWALPRAADELLARLEELRRMYPRSPVGLIADGEVSSPVTGSGVGGRNSAFVLYCAEKIAHRPIAVLSAGTDGIDGNSPAAGAVADGSTFERARAAGLDPQDYFCRSDAYTFFAHLGDAIETGPTGTNLRDLRILLAAPE